VPFCNPELRNFRHNTSASVLEYPGVSAGAFADRASAIPILALGFVLGVSFEAGPLGVLAFIAIAACWSLAFAGFG